ncbi:hypothetical protein GTO91_10740 [Heliobacterium undosum]|uniref:Uncharacterized protein n=1 Tax=Heliomicrobium undosum TaxID=121734 RepID=A0A845L553_9FIRM|nr:hypothetical protein [Heliomicrobium undosum]MZP30185.1 hypothetical protein [Heliomicrobium undosum]
MDSQIFYVETFEDPHAYYQQLKIYEDEMHITGGHVLANWIRQRGAYLGPGSPSVWSYEGLQRRLYRRWYQPLTRIFLETKVRECIQRLFSEDNPLKRALINDLETIVREFCLLAELGIFALPPVSQPDPALAFQKIVTSLMTDPQVRDIINIYHSVTYEHLCHELNEGKSIRRIYLYQLDKIDAMRMVFFHRLRHWGIKVVFRIPFYAYCPSISAPWRELYEAITGVGCKEWSYSCTAQFRKGQQLIRFLEGIDSAGAERRETLTRMLAPEDCLDLGIVEFNSPAQFKSYLRTHPPTNLKQKIAAPEADQLNQAFGDALPTRRKQEMAGHPLYRFIHAVYRCRRREPDFELDWNTFVQIAASPWVDTKQVSGMAAVGFLDDLSDYMQGVTTLKEIRRRLGCLEELQRASRVFDDLARDQVNRNRMARYLSNPLRVFVYVHGERYSVTLKQVVDLVSIVESMLRRLLPVEGTSVSVGAHFESWRRIIESLRGQLETTIKDDLPFFERFERMLLINFPDEWRAERPELESYMMVCLYGPGTQQNAVDVIHSLEQLDGLVLTSESIHLTNMSLEATQKSERNEFGHYLTNEWVRTAANRLSNQNWRSLLLRCLDVDFLWKSKLREGFTDFSLFYAVAFCRKKLTVSWIRQWHRHDAPGLAWHVLSSLYPKSEIENKIDMLGFRTSTPTSITENTSSFAVETPEMENTEKTDEIINIISQFPEVFYLDIDFCPLKFFYTAIIDQQPLYSTDFHQKLVFAAVASLLAEQADGRKQVREFLFPLFPQWTDTLKENLLITTSIHGLREYRSFQNVHYPSAMAGLQRLRSRYGQTAYKIREAYRDGKPIKVKWLKDWFRTLLNTNTQSKGGQHCRMCPHLSLCLEGVYVVDEDKHRH